jgi:hypothetical protein
MLRILKCKIPTFGSITEYISTAIPSNVRNAGRIQANLATGINKLTGTLQGLNKGFLDNVEQITKVFTRNNELIKSYGITEDAAQDMGFAIDKLSIDLRFWS